MATRPYVGGRDRNGIVRAAELLRYLESYPTALLDESYVTSNAELLGPLREIVLRVYDEAAGGLAKRLSRDGSRKRTMSGSTSAAWWLIVRRMAIDVELRLARHKDLIPESYEKFRWATEVEILAACARDKGDVYHLCSHCSAREDCDVPPDARCREDTTRWTSRSTGGSTTVLCSTNQRLRNGSEQVCRLRPR